MASNVNHLVEKATGFSVIKENNGIYKEIEQCCNCGDATKIRIERWESGRIDIFCQCGEWLGDIWPNSLVRA